MRRDLAWFVAALSITAAELSVGVASSQFVAELLA